jgi:hypothetical protein
MANALTRLSSVAIGGLVVYDLPADEVALPEGLVHREPGLTIRGLIGIDVLRRFITTIDYANETLTFDTAKDFVPPGRAIALPMRMVAGGRAPGIPIAIDGHYGVFMIDTGNSGWPDIKAAFAAGHPRHVLAFVCRERLVSHPRTGLRRRSRLRREPLGGQRRIDRL